jgi:hypothetical protein
MSSAKTRCVCTLRVDRFSGSVARCPVKTVGYHCGPCARKRAQRNRAQALRSYSRRVRKDDRWLARHVAKAKP